MPACGKCTECYSWLKYRKHSSKTMLSYDVAGLTYEKRRESALEQARKHCTQNAKVL